MNNESPGLEASIDASIKAQIFTSILTSVILAGLMAFGLWDQLAAESLTYWLAALLIISSLRLLAGYLHFPLNRNGRFQLPLTMIAGAVWGASAPLFLPELDAQHQVLLIIFLVGLVAGSSNAYAGRMQLFYAFMLPLLVPLGIWFFSQNARVYTILGITDLLYMLALSIIARRNTLLLNDTMRKNMQLADEIRLRELHEQRLEIQQRILDAIARHHGVLPEILTTIAHQVEAQRPDMIASILLLDDEGKHLHSGAAPGLPDAWNAAIDGAEIGPAAGSCGTAAFRNERVIVADIATDPLWVDYQEAALAFGLKACWSEPIRSAGGDVLGTFAMYYHDIRHPSGEEIQLIEHLASLTSIAIDNCRNREQLELLIRAVDASYESIMVLDAEGVIEFANPSAAALYQKPVEQIIGIGAAVLRGGSTGDDTYNDIIATIKHGNIWCGEILLHAGEADERLVARRISPIMDDGGHINHQICIDRDITEAKQRSQQLEHTQRLESLGILAGGIAHDFNNLLTSIMGNAAMAECGMDKNGDIRIALANIRTSSQRAADLCKQMLAYSGKGRFVIEPTDISKLIREMTRLMEVSIGKQITIRYALNENLPLVDVDTAQIQQVILNLITNANEAIGEANGEIAFCTGIMQAGRAYLNATLTNEKLPKGKYIYIEVADSGCGMDKKTIEKMFDPFFTTKFTGRGLGMSAVLGIVRAHHGAIRVNSQPENGTTFRILLPVGDNSSSAQPVEKIKPVQASRCNGTILIVDDEPVIREIAHAILEDVGFDIIEAVDGKQAVELYRQHQSDISAVLLDMTMPKMDGKACFVELRKINPDVRVLLSSGYSEQDITELFAGLDLAGFIQKPYLPESLQQQMDEILGK
ncbi:MAG: response regulator [Mariprofundus sp.]|nr:response regulator [Mariprofundus sp.]